MSLRPIRWLLILTCFLGFAALVSATPDAAVAGEIETTEVMTVHADVDVPHENEICSAADEDPLDELLTLKTNDANGPTIAHSPPGDPGGNVNNFVAMTNLDERLAWTVPRSYLERANDELNAKLTNATAGVNVGKNQLAHAA